MIKREQHYLDIHHPTYNVLRKAGSSAGYVHTEASIEKLKNRVVSDSTLEKMRKRVQNKETITLIRENTGIPVKITNITEETSSIFPSRKEAGKHLGVSDSTIGHYIRSGKLLFNVYQIL